MTKEKATLNFMVHTLESLYPQHNEYPLQELRNLEETEGDDSDRWNDYADYIKHAYWMKRDIEIISEGSIRFY